MPLTVTRRADELGLKRIPEAESGGPLGGVLVWSFLSGRRPPTGVRPVSIETVKHATPFLAPPLTTQAEDCYVSGSLGERL